MTSRGFLANRVFVRTVSLRFRVISLLLLLAAPLLVTGIAVSWQDYLFERALPLGDIQMLGRIAEPGGRAAVANLRDLLETLARSPEAIGGSPDLCNDYLTHLFATKSNDFAGLGVADPDGQLWCAMPRSLVGSRIATQPPVAAALSTRAFSIGSMASSAGTPLILAATPIVAGGRLNGVVAATVPVSWFADRAVPSEPGLAAWLVDPATGWLPILPDEPASLPLEAVMRQLSTTASLVEERSIQGSRTAYGATAIGGGLRLVVARDASRAIAAAQARLRDRTGLLVVLLVAAIGAAVVGADHAIVSPVRRVSRAVLEWRQDAEFRVERADRLPPELAGLTTSFAAAVERLNLREAELRRAVAQQELAMQEIHHRVKNNLQIVASLLNLQASRIRLPEARAEFQSARDRVRALATLHRHLYVQGELHTIDMRDFLVELCGQLFQAMGEVEGDRISLEVSAPALQLLSDQAVPLALIVTESVGNALKYAFPGGRSGRITVSLDSSSDNARLIVQDNGVGMPAGRSETETGTRDGLGLQLIRGFARQLGAALTVDQGDGTRYVVEMPLKRKRDEEAIKPRSFPAKATT